MMRTARRATLGALMAAIAVLGLGAVTPIRAEAVDRAAYIQSVVGMAQRTQSQYGVPASVTIAQSILESGWGASSLTTLGNAYFGIKCFSKVSPYQMGCMNVSSLEYYDPQKPIFQVSAFRIYHSAEDSFTDHAYFLRTNSRYAPAFSTTSSDDFIRAVALAGYATDPKYADLVIGIMRQHNLYRYDSPGYSVNLIQLPEPYRSAAIVDLGFPIGGELAGPISGSKMWMFNSGIVASTQTYGTFPLTGQFFDRYRTTAVVRSGLGFLASGISAQGSALVQRFQNGAMYGDSTRTYESWGPVQASYRKWYETLGPLGMPRSSVLCGASGGGCFQQFDQGMILWRPDLGSFATWGPIADEYQRWSGYSGPLGYPVSDVLCGAPGGGCFQHFEKGKIFWKPGVGAFATWGDISASYVKWGLFSGPLGNPTSAVLCGASGGGCFQYFEKGTISWRPDLGAFASWGPISTQYMARGFYDGVLGYPVSDVMCGAPAGGCLQSFEHGVITFPSGRPAIATWGEISAQYRSTGLMDGPLGYPTSELMCGATGGGCLQIFDRGQILLQPGRPPRATWGGIAAEYQRWGGHDGPLGYPTSQLMCGATQGGCLQLFEKGRILQKPGIGAFATWGEFETAYLKEGGYEGALGYPTSAVACGAPEGGCYQYFEHGTLTWHPAAGVNLVKGAISEQYRRWWLASGPLGYPKGPSSCTSTGCRQSFERGTIYQESGKLAFASWSEMDKIYQANGGEKGPLGFPTSSVLCGASRGGCFQNFKSGVVLWQPQLGASASWAEIAQTYRTMGLYNSDLGYPTSSMTCSTEGVKKCVQRFELGGLTWTASTGVVRTKP